MNNDPPLALQQRLHNLTFASLGRLSDRGTLCRELHLAAVWLASDLRDHRPGYANRYVKVRIYL